MGDVNAKFHVSDHVPHKHNEPHPHLAAEAHKLLGDGAKQSGYTDGKADKYMGAMGSDSSDHAYQRNDPQSKERLHQNNNAMGQGDKGTSKNKPDLSDEQMKSMQKIIDDELKLNPPDQHARDTLDKFKSKPMNRDFMDTFPNKHE